MRFKAVLSLLSFFLIASTACDCTSQGPDTVAPIVGTLSASNPTTSTVTLSLTPSTDSVTAAEALEYRAYFSLADDIGAVDDVLTHGTAAGEWQSGVAAWTVESLALGTRYYFNVIVRDEAGNVSTYETVNESTLDGAWGDEELVEDYTGGSVYYSSLSASSKGDVAARWIRQTTWEAHFAVRTPDAESFDAPLPWIEPETNTPRLDYGFDDALFGTSIKDNGDGTADVLFAKYSGGTSVVQEPVATGVPEDFELSSRACVDTNGDVMAVWIDGTTPTARSVRARVRSGGTWGMPSLVSASEGLDLGQLEVVCSPDGDHVVLFADDSGTPTKLSARVYDPDLDAWGTGPTPLSDEDYQSTVAAARTLDGRVVAVWIEYDADTTTRFLKSRRYDGIAWSAAADTLLSTTGTLSALAVAAAGNDVHAVWRGGMQVSTRRLPAGTSMWTDETPLHTTMSFLELKLSGDSFGDALLVWVESSSIRAQRYSPSSSTWGMTMPVKEGGQSVGLGSMSGILDARRRATVTWTAYDPDEVQFSVWARTFR